MAKKILIIEDDKFLGDVLVQKLTHEGFEVSLSVDGADGLKQIGIQKPDMLILDMVLPSLNGYEILEAKQKDPAIAAIPVIVVSNSGQPVEISRVLALGVRDYLIKAQLDPDEVLAKIKLHLADAEHGTEASAGSRLQNIKVMWVEDDTFLSDLIAHKLSMEKGMQLLNASNGEDALVILEKETPDIILLDLILPGLSGFDILTKIKQEERLKHIPVIILSNLGQESDKTKALSLGAARYLVKANLAPKDIVAEILAVLGK